MVLIIPYRKNKLFQEFYDLYSTGLIILKNPVNFHQIQNEYKRIPKGFCRTQIALLFINCPGAPTWEADNDINGIFPITRLTLDKFNPVNSPSLISASKSNLPPFSLNVSYHRLLLPTSP